MPLLELLLALYVLLGLALAAFVVLWLVAYRLGAREVVTGRGGIVMAPAYRRRLVQLAKGAWYQVVVRAGWLCFYALLAWPMLFLALFWEKKARRH